MKGGSALSGCQLPVPGPRATLWGCSPGSRADLVPGGRGALTPACALAVSSGSVTVNADSSVQLLAEEAVTLDMLDLGVSVPKGETEALSRRELREGSQDGGGVGTRPGSAGPSPATHPVQAAKANLEKAQSELSGAADEAARAEIQIRIEANEALVKALE